MKYSIVIPTYNHLEDALKPCLESILQYTSFEETEIVVVCNGCTDGTEQYLSSVKKLIGDSLKVVIHPEPLGYPISVNLGIKNSVGKYIVLLNNDTVILPSEVNAWLRILEEPFNIDEKVGITGPMKASAGYTNYDFLIFFCVMIKKQTFDELGLLDEFFTPGFAEDIDYSIRVQKAGYKIVQVPSEDRQYSDPQNRRMVGGFPIYHYGEATFRETPNGGELIRRNSLYVMKKHLGPNASIKLNLGCGDNPIHGYANIDLYNDRSDFKMDIRQLEFDNETVEEIYASHVFEHISPFDVNGTINEWFRVLKPGGRIKLEMPDIKALCANFATADKDRRYLLINCIYGTPGGPGSNHLYGWYDEILYDHFSSHGFVDIKVYPATETTHWGHNLILEASKPTVTVQNGKIYDCFPFNDELDVLEIRLNEMYDTVEKFIIVEGTKNFANKDKPLYFFNNRKRFAKFMNKIVHVIVDEWPEYTDSWVYERFQRDQILVGLKQCNLQDNDIVIISDLDEIPNSDVIKTYKVSDGLMNLEQLLYYYNFNCRAEEIWNWAKILPYSQMKNMTPCEVRYKYDRIPNSPTLKNAGWHFSFFGDVNGVIEKIKSTAHQEYNIEKFKNPEKIYEAITKGTDLYDRGVNFKLVEIDNTYPKYVLSNTEYYKKISFLRQ